MGDASKPVDRETLYNEVWTEPVTVVAQRYGLSDVGLAKICRSLAIPLPSRGYWAKIKAGKIMGRAPLPALKQLGPRTTGLVKLPPETIAARETAKKTIARVCEETSPMSSPEEASSPHPLVRAASKRLRQRDGWPENILLRSVPKEVLNISVARDSFDRVFNLADAILKELDKQGFEFEIDTERGATLLRWKETGTKLTFALTEHVRRTRHEITSAEEKARKRYWERSRWDSSVSFPHIPIYDYTPTGVMAIQVGCWPSRTWKDTPRTQLELRLGEIVGGILVLAQETHAKEMDEARQAEAKRRTKARYEFLVKRRMEETERFKNLEHQANDWERAARLRAYVKALEESLKTECGEISAEQRDWLAWARAKADGLDPLIHVSDPILGAPEPTRSNW
jgi:hypothetical protein